MRWPKWGLAGLTALAGISFWLLLAGPERLFGIELGNAGIGRSIVLLLVAWAVISQLLAGRWKGKVLEDERDRDIERIAASWARIALVVVVVGFVVLLGFTPVERLAWATPIAISHLLLFGLVLHSLVEYAVTAGAYWRDRHA